MLRHLRHVVSTVIMNYIVVSIATQLATRTEFKQRQQSSNDSAGLAQTVARHAAKYIQCCRRSIMGYYTFINIFKCGYWQTSNRGNENQKYTQEELMVTTAEVGKKYLPS